MIAVEFEAKAESGVIRIPPQFHEFAAQRLRVILMMDQPAARAKRRPGTAKGLVRVSDDFSAPLSDAEFKELFGS